MHQPSFARRITGATRLAVAFSLIGGAALRAQPPEVRPVAVDSIYRLAVDSADYKEYPYVFLLDDGIFRVETDGRSTQRYHQVVQVLKPKGVEAWAERRFAYRPGHDTLIVNWMRVVKRTGELISDKPSISQASDVPAAMSNPVYSDTKVLRYSLAGITVGSLVDISWTTETTHPFLRGDFSDGWRTTMEYPAMRSRYVADVPAAMTPRIVEHHLDFPRREERADGRHYYLWATQAVKPVKGEMFAPDSSVPAVSIMVSTPLQWADVARWYGDLAKDRYVLTSGAVAKVDSIARAQRTMDDTLRSIHRWIAKDIRYVSVALGLGGYQPRFPDSTITSGFGDCKDKATLFIAAAQHLGLTAYPVLLNSSGVADTTLPTITQFDHVIAALKRKGSKGYTFLDLTTSAFPPGEVPPSYQGEFGLVVLPGGKSEEVTFPEDSAGSTRNTFQGEVSADGKVSGRYTSVTSGRPELGMRAAFAEPLDSARRAQLARAFERMFPNAKVDTVVTFDGRDLHAPPVFSVTLHDGDAFKRAGSVAILAVPQSVRGSVFLGNALPELKNAGERKLPIDATKLLGEAKTVTEFRLTLPEGWKAQLPKSVTATSVFGDYRSEYAQDGRVLRIWHSAVGAKGVYPKDRIGELQAWLKALVDDNVDSIVLLPPPIP